jgi:hypothetical protein
MGAMLEYKILIGLDIGWVGQPRYRGVSSAVMYFPYFLSREFPGFPRSKPVGAEFRVPTQGFPSL